MPRAFTADETDRIRGGLRLAAAEAFSRRGVRRTTVDELARAAGISKGAFYRFYDSKESLLVALIDEIELSTHAEIEAAVRADPSRGIDVLVDSALFAIDRNPLLAVLMSDEGLRVMQSLPDAERQSLLERDVRLTDRISAVLREAGVVPAVPQPVLVGLLRSLAFLGLHRAEIGADLVDGVGAWLKQCLKASLLSSPAPSGKERPA